MNRTISAPISAPAGFSTPAVPVTNNLDGDFVQRSISTMPSWQQSVEDQATGYSLFSQAAASRRPATLQPISETSMFSNDGMVEYDPEEFVNAFSSLWLDSSTSQFTQIRRLCLHECTTLKSAVFENILPRLTQVTHLDLAHTKVNDKALMSIADTARMTHLNLERCTQITGNAVVDFVTQHPAVRDTIVWLSLNADASRYRLLASEDLDRLLPALPRTLRSLNLGGARISSQHVPALQTLATQVEELGLKGANLSLGSDIVQILSLVGENGKPKDTNKKSSVRYIDLTDISSVTQMSLNYSPVSIKDKGSLPLEVIELSGTVLTEILRRNKNVKNPDWTVKELGRRGWYVRAPESLPPSQETDDGYRSWKMGARWWGMRKIPMVEQEVGGMYGYFMFKRN